MEDRSMPIAVHNAKEEIKRRIKKYGANVQEFSEKDLRRVAKALVRIDPKWLRKAKQTMEKESDRYNYR